MFTGRSSAEIMWFVRKCEAELIGVRKFVSHYKEVGKKMVDRDWTMYRENENRENV